MPALRRGDDDGEAVSHQTQSNAFHHSGFTPINAQPTQAVTLQPLPIQQGRENTKQLRKHNRTVARYLGLGRLKEPPRLEKFAPGQPQACETPRKRKRTCKERKQLQETIAAKQKSEVADTDCNVWDERTVFDNFGDTAPVSTSSTLEMEDSLRPPPPFEPSQFSQPVDSLPVNLSKDGTSVHSQKSPSDSAASNVAATEAGVDDDCLVIAYANGLQSFSRMGGIESQPYRHMNMLSNLVPDLLKDTDSDFDENPADDDLLMLTSDIIDHVESVDNVQNPPLGSLTENETSSMEQHATDRHASIPESIAPIQSQGLLQPYISPITPRNRNPDIAAIENHTPIVRSPFPATVHGDSPIVGLSSCTMLRTCFRIGEAISQASHATKTNRNVIFELYARVLKSEREHSTQRFMLGDVFHTRPPYIEATYDATIWKSVQLFNHDSRQLLQPKEACRCMGTIRREGKKWIMEVLNIWEATWDDITWVEGIVNS